MYTYFPDHSHMSWGATGYLRAFECPFHLCTHYGSCDEYVHVYNTSQ